MITLKDRRIVLIGGAGFIGHNLALLLRRKGANVDIIDGLDVNNLLTFSSVDCAVEQREFYRSMLEQRLALLSGAEIPLHVQDARDYHMMNGILNQIKPDVIVHLAAVAHANKSNKDPHSTFDHSLRTLENALDYARERIEHFVYFSSSMAYGHFPAGEVTEDTPCDPIGIYGVLKYAGEKMVRAYNHAFDLPYTIVRPSALYGERCVSRRVGQIFIENALAAKTITVTGDGSDKLDFTYIDDLAGGIVNVLESENAKNDTFNLTYGEARSLAQMADLIREHFPSIEISYVPKDKLTPDRGTLCVDKARDRIGYDPQWPLEKGFVKYIEWYKDFYKRVVT
jgi:nucleoside-diphosphate-sugar epimerase